MIGVPSRPEGLVSAQVKKEVRPGIFFFAALPDSMRGRVNARQRAVVAVDSAHARARRLVSVTFRPARYVDTRTSKCRVTREHPSASATGRYGDETLFARSPLRAFAKSSASSALNVC